MYIIYPVVTLGVKNNHGRLGVIYRNMRTFMLNRGVVFSNGYFVPDNLVSECVDKLRQYKHNWIAEGGREGDFNILRFELQCHDVDTFTYCRRAVRQCCYSRLSKTYDKLSTSKGRLKDIRHLKGVTQDITYVEAFAEMFSELKEPLSLMRHASVAFTTSSEEGLKLYAEAMRLLEWCE